MPKLIILSAPSGAGKTTLCSMLLRAHPKALALSISCTTRAPRTGEVGGREYFFLTKEAFEARIQKGDFAEWAQVHGNYYGTLKETLLSNFAKGQSVVLDIDVQGSALLQAAFPDQCVTIFITPPNFDELRSRLEARGQDPKEVIDRRMANAKKEMDRAKDFQHQIVNDDLQKAFTKLNTLVSAILNEETT